MMSMMQRAPFCWVVREGLSEEAPLNCDLIGANCAKTFWGESPTRRGDSDCRGS